ncbi:MAG TPA: radical SAM protein [Vicinamibacterales bacterium]|nr:radical SAM protein [Vicinamibacterales bacterium]
MSAQPARSGLLDRTVVRALRAVPQYTRLSRHVRSVLAHSTPRKVANLLLTELEYKLRATKVRGRPYILIVDPTNICNLKCPLCPTGNGTGGRKKQLMKYETFTRVIDELAPYAYEVNMHNWGESILHPHVFDMVEYARKRNVATNMSAHFNTVNEQTIDRLVTSGLEYLCLSIDGATQESYAKYRVGGSLDKVLDNARKLVQRRRELKSSTPFIEWQFIVFKHNAGEIAAARELAKEIGVDKFRLIPPGIAFEMTDTERLKREWFVPAGTEVEGESADYRSQHDAPCFYLYRSFTVNPDGQVAPCCIVYGEHNDFGNFMDDGFRSIWNGAKYQSARAQFRKGGVVTTPTVCDGCSWFKKPGDDHVAASLAGRAN